MLTNKPGNYTIGRGRVYFAKYLPGTKTPGAERYLGNTPDFKIAITSETLEHFSSEAGIKEVDEAATLKTTRKVTLKTDNIDPENVALYFLGEASKVTVAGGAVAGEVIDGARVVEGSLFQLGFSAANFQGARDIEAASVVIKNAAGTTTYVEGTDYEVNYDAGLVRVVPGGAIVEGANLQANYTVNAHSREQVVSGATAIEGMLRFVSDNPTGDNADYTFPYARIAPSGDFMLKGDTWQEVDFTGDIIKLGSLPAMFRDGRPIV